MSTLSTAIGLATSTALAAANDPGQRLENRLDRLGDHAERRRFLRERVPALFQ